MSPRRIARTGLLLLALDTVGGFALTAVAALLPMAAPETPAPVAVAEVRVDEAGRLAWADGRAWSVEATPSEAPR